nr:DNA translocase FtsK [Bacteroidota bacterium]
NNSNDDDDENNNDSAIELTIENPQPEEEKKENKKNIIEHQTLDTEYDPTLDLADYQYPTLELLDDYDSGEISVQKEELESNKDRIVETLLNYSIKIDKIRATIGPTVTLYEIIPAPGIRISKIKNLEDDIALSLAALGIRIIAPIPGKGTIGIEVPNSNPDIVSMRSVLASDKFQNTKYELPFGMGKTIANEVYVADLTKMPHILMAGATGQGKSVGLNAIISSLLYKKHPAELKFVMVDPKKVELTLFSKIERHYLAKLPDSEEAIITDTRKVVRTLNSLGIEMDTRYELLKDAHVKNIKEYNTKFLSRRLDPNQGHHFMPYIVLVIDEFADLIMTAGKEIEIPLTRLAQLARAVGIHLIIATQRPSVNIITGSIKANFPARVAFRVISKIDSRTILDGTGADQLIGRGDMLFSTGSELIRMQCAFIDTPEIEKITNFIGEQRAYPNAYQLPEFADEQDLPITDFDPNEKDSLFEDAARIIVQNQQGSTSLLQRKMKIGYNRAGRIVDQLEAAGIVGSFEGSKARAVLINSEYELEQFLNDMESDRNI